jgi:hypothetical protein
MFADDTICKIWKDLLQMAGTTARDSQFRKP